VTLTKALSLSLNTVAVRLGLEVGPKTVVKTAHRLGISSDLEPNASIALGTSEVTPLELVAAYAAFANGGIGVQPHVISRVRTASGKQLYARKNASFGRVIDPQYVAMMNTMMEETLLTGTAHKAELPGWQAAGKTGTSQEWRDAWFVGYTSYLVAGVWLGNDDGTPTKKVSGGNLPVEIWSRFMKGAHEGVPVAALPSGVWRNADTPAPETAPPLAPPDPQPEAVPMAGPPMTINRGCVTRHPPPAPTPPPPRRDIAPVSAPSGNWDAPVPPASIPNAGGANAGQPARQKSLLSKLFGGA
jgi:penicillin-binding protein 1A